MALGVQFTNKQKFINHFIDLEFPCFVVQDSMQNVLLKHESENVEQSSEVLLKYLNSIDNSNRQIFIIKHFSSFPDGGFNKKLEADALTTYKNEVSEIENTQRLNGYETNRLLLDEIRTMREDLNNVNLKLAVLNSEDDEDIEEESQPAGILGAVLNNPNLMTIITNILTSISANLMTPPKQNVSLAGINEQDEISILKVLYSKGITIDDLYKISQLDQAQISMFLKMLRSM